MKSQNGWPVLASGSDKLHKWKVPGANRYFVLRNGSAGFLLSHFAYWYDKKIEPIDGGVWDEWAYAYRPIRGQFVGYSNHASGTAIDLNATSYPLGTNRMLSWKAIKIRAKLATTYRGTIRWGGDYSGRKDQMHYEINKPIANCEKVARRLMRTKSGRKILAANKGQASVIRS